MKKILFPTDFSFASLNAFKYALHLANTINAEIVTLHVYNQPVGTYLDYYDFLAENYSIRDWSEFENFKSDVPKLREIAEQEHLGGIKISHMLNNGSVVDIIVNVAADEKVDFIVIGTTGVSGLHEVFLGSITEDVLSKSTATVLAVPEWCTYNPIKNLLFLTRFKEYQMPLLRNLYELAKLFHAHIDVLHVTSEHDENESDVMNKWREAFPALNMNFYKIRSTDVEGTVIDFIETNNIDIVSMPVHHKGFFKKMFAVSLSQKLTFHSKVPIMGLYTKNQG